LLLGSHRILLYLLISFIISGIIRGITLDYESIDATIHALLIAVLLFIWCGRHAEENGIYPPAGARILCALIAIFGVPFYLFKAFGFKLGGVKVLFGLALTLAAFLTYEIAFYLTRITLYWI